MKVFVFIVICIVAVTGQGSKLRISDEFHEKLKVYRKECIMEMKLDPRLINEEKDATIPSPQEATCFQACLDKKFGMMNEDGSYNLERMKDVAGTPKSREEAEKIYNGKIKDCLTEVGHNPCKMAACAHSMPREMWAKKE